MKVRCLWTALSSAAVVLAILGSANVQAQTTVAQNDGDWSDPLNWSAGVPVVGTWAAINSGHTLDVTPGAVVGLLDVGGGAGQTGNLNIGAGADLTAVAFRVGQSAGAIGDVTMTGGSASANCVNCGNFLDGDILIGDAGKGTWTITDGTLTAQDEFLIGFINAADGTLNVDGGTVNAGRVLTVGVLGNGKGALNVSGGIVNANLDLLSGLNAGTSSTITQSGGTINVGQHFIHGVRGSASYTQTGGAVNVTGVNSRLTVAEDHTSANWDLQDGSIASTHIFLGDFDSSHGTMKVSGGSIALTGNLNVGGALASNGGEALNADGTFIISGSGGTIDVGGNLLANPDDNSRGENGATLIFEVLDATGVSTINVAGFADLNGAEINVDVLGGPFVSGDTFDLITAESFTNDFIRVADGVGVFSLAVVAGGNGQILRATLVPEPTSIALFGIAALGCLVCRKSKWRVAART